MDSTRLEALIHKAFMECGYSGRRYDRTDIIASLAIEVMDHTIWSQEFTAIELSDELALLTYKCARIDADGNLSRHSFRTSCWQMTDEGWKIRFHQATPTEAFERLELE